MILCTRLHGLKSSPLRHQVHLHRRGRILCRMILRTGLVKPTQVLQVYV